MATGPSLSRAILKRLGAFVSLRRRVRVVTRIVPSRHWYRAAVYACRAHSWLTVGLGGGNRRLTEAVMLDHWLRELTLYAPYPIPWRGVGVEVLNRDDSRRGVIFCWTHVPLVELTLHALLQMGGYAPLVVADPGNIFDGEFIVPGMAKRLPAIPTDLYVLLKMRTVLRQGGSIALLADTAIGEPLSSALLRFAGSVGARVIFFWAERGTGCAVDVHFMDPPRPLCASEEDVAVNMEFLRAENRRLLSSLGFGGDYLDGVGCGHER